jgi:long-chain acyl-CoA synthetase
LLHSGDVTVDFVSRRGKLFESPTIVSKQTGWISRGPPMFPTLSFGDQEFTPHDLANRSAKAAGVLASIGIAEGDTFAVMLRNSPMLVEIMLAARQIGAYFVPLNWHFKAHEAGFILRDSGAKALVIHDDLLDQICDGVPHDMPLLEVKPDAGADVQHGSGAPSRRHAIDWYARLAQAEPHTTASDRPRGMIAYTSGTTGEPKGVRRLPPRAEEVLAGAERLARMLQAGLGIRPEARCLVSAPLYHSAPASYVVLASQCGAWLRVELRFDAESTLASIDHYRISHVYLVPTMFVRLLRLPPEVRARYDLSSLQYVVSTGAPCAPNIKRAMIEWLGDVIYETYAASELGYLTSISSKEARAKPGSAGRPIEGVAIRILDDQCRDVPPGTIGKIYARQAMAPEFTYINRQQDRDAIEQEGFVTVGDIGYLDTDGYLYVTDRRSDLVLSGGVNIYPAEIEAQLIEIAGVADCAVFGVPDAEFGQSLIAVIQPSVDVVLTSKDVQAFLSERLADFKIPRVIEFRDKLPREETGKIFKRKLRDEYTARTRARTDIDQSIAVRN